MAAQRTVVIRHLQGEIDLATEGCNSMACIYAHVKHQQSEKMSTLGLLVSLLIQLALVSNECLSSMELFWRRHAALPEPSTDKVLSLLKTELNKFKTVFLLLDGVDEWPVEGLSCSLPTFISTIQSLLLGNVKLLITSRPNPIIEKLMSSGKRIMIEASDADLRRYIKARIESSPSGNTLVTQTAKSETDLCDELVKQSKGV